MLRILKAEKVNGRAVRRVRVQREPADCEYLVDGRLCKAVIEQSEGRDVRKTIVAIYVSTVINVK